MPFTLFSLIPTKAMRKRCITEKPNQSSALTMPEGVPKNPSTTFGGPPPFRQGRRLPSGEVGTLCPRCRKRTQNLQTEPKGYPKLYISTARGEVCE